MDETNGGGMPLVKWTVEWPRTFAERVAFFPGLDALDGARMVGTRTALVLGPAYQSGGAAVIVRWCLDPFSASVSCRDIADLDEDRRRQFAEALLWWVTQGVALDNQRWLDEQAATARPLPTNPVDLAAHALGLDRGRP